MTERTFAGCSNLTHGRRPGTRPGLPILILFALTLVLAACRAKTPDPAENPLQGRPFGTTAAVKLLTAADGVYAVPASALRSAGFDISAVQADALSLTHEGRPVALQLVGQGKNQGTAFLRPGAAADGLHRSERLLAGSGRFIRRSGTGYCRARRSAGWGFCAGRQRDDDRHGHCACRGAKTLRRDGWRRATTAGCGRPSLRLLKL